MLWLLLGSSGLTCGKGNCLDFEYSVCLECSACAAKVLVVGKPIIEYSKI